MMQGWTAWWAADLQAEAPGERGQRRRLVRALLAGLLLPVARRTVRHTALQASQGPQECSQRPCLGPAAQQVEPHCLPQPRACRINPSEELFSGLWSQGQLLT